VYDSEPEREAVRLAKAERRAAARAAKRLGRGSGGESGSTSLDGSLEDVESATEASSSRPVVEQETRSSYFGKKSSSKSYGPPLRLVSSVLTGRCSALPRRPDRPSASHGGSIASSLHCILDILGQVLSSTVDTTAERVDRQPRPHPLAPSDPTSPDDHVPAPSYPSSA
jgi:hypothetical protein